MYRLCIKHYRWGLCLFDFFQQFGRSVHPNAVSARYSFGRITSSKTDAQFGQRLRAFSSDDISPFFFHSLSSIICAACREAADQPHHSQGFDLIRFARFLFLNGIYFFTC